MTPFYTRFPVLAACETRCIHIINPGGALPVGEYAFVELYCENPDCDCRRMLVQVTTAKMPHTVLATINYGWESEAFYTKWMHGDAKAGREITEACLDPLNPQSQYADHLLDLFRDIVRTDADYVARLASHYDLFKSTQQPRTESILTDDDEGPGPWEDDADIDREDRPDDAFGLPPDELPDIPKPAPHIAPPKAGRNDPCPCGSGRKYKKCCGK